MINCELGKRVVVSEKALNILIVGCGKMGMLHFKAIQQLMNKQWEAYYKAGVENSLKNVRVCALYDVIPRENLGTQEVPFFSNFEKALNHKIPDIAIIASPTKTHFSITKQLLEKGVHCLVEKPLCECYNDGIILANIAKEKNIQLICGHIERYNPVSDQLSCIIKDNEFGTPVSYSLQRSQERPLRIPDDIITDKVIHDLDLVCHWFGSVEKIEVLNHHYVNSRVQDCHLKIYHTSSTIGELLVSWLIHDRRRGGTIKFKNTTIDIDLLAKEYSIDGVQQDRFINSRRQNNQLKDQFVDFVGMVSGAITEHGPIKPLITIDEILESLRLIDIIRKIIE